MLYRELLQIGIPCCHTYDLITNLFLSCRLVRHLSSKSILAPASAEVTLNGEEPAIIPSPPEGEGKGEGDIYVFTIMRLLISLE